MKLKKLKKICSFFCICTCIPLGTWAQVVITEIMYDIEGTDTGREWVEVQNTGNLAIDFSAWKLFEANTNHKITAVGDTSLPAGAFAVIADNPEKFKTDNPQFSGLLFDSVFSLSNEGEALIVRDSAGADSDSVSYSPTLGGAGDGTTLQKTSTGWISALSTPGSLTTATESVYPIVNASSTDNQSVSDETDGSTNDSSEVDNLSTHSSQSVALISRDKEELQVTAGRSRLGFVGSPLIFEGKIKTAKTVGSGSLQAAWSFGDGTQETGERVRHTYQFSGDYIVVLNASLGQSSSVTKIKVKIIEPEVSLSIGGAEFVQITNNSNFELNVGGWILESADKRFVFPTDTLISKRSSIKVSTTQSDLYPLKEYARLANPSGKILSVVQGISEKTLQPMIILPPGIDEEYVMRKIKEML